MKQLSQRDEGPDYSAACLFFFAFAIFSTGVEMRGGVVFITCFMGLVGIDPDQQ